MQVYNLSEKGNISIHNTIHINDSEPNCFCNSITYQEIEPNNDKDYTYVSEINNSNNYEFIYISEGGGVCQLSNDEPQEISTGYIARIVSGQRAIFTPAKNKRTSFYHISVSGLQYTLFFERISLFQDKAIENIGQNVIIEGIFENMLIVFKDNKKGSQLLLATSMFHVLGVANFKTLNYNDRENPITNKINIAKEILRNDVTAKISPENVAEEIGVSYSLFRRIFKEYMGISPAQYQMDIRLKRAQELLTTTNYSIAKTAEILGFSDTAQFSTFFRKRQNMTPRDYRNKYK